MTLSRLFVLLTAGIFAVYGFAFVMAPEALALWATGATPNSPSAVTDMRATYGGMSLAIGGILIALSGDQIRLGLLAVLLLMASMALSRAFGMIMDGPTNSVMGAYLALEVVAALAAAYILAVSRSGGTD